MNTSQSSSNDPAGLFSKDLVPSRPLIPHDQTPAVDNHLCSYSNCFRNATKKRGFIYVCDFHLHNPNKWGKDGMTFTGSKFFKKEL